MIPYILTALGGYLVGSSVKQYADGGQVQLLAPNEKPSNLTPEQYKLVRTPEFKAWFGDWENDSENASKVVDENGEPKVMWHYAKRLQYELDKFYVFNVDKQLGSHFGTIKQAQNLKYIPSGESELKTPEKDLTDFRYYQVFLNIKNPIRIKDVGIFGEEELLDAIDLIKPLKGYDWEYFNMYDRKLSRLNRIKDWLLRTLDIDGIVYLNRYETNANTFLIASLDDVSDGLFKTKIPDAEDSWIAFYPEQIKIADGTNTTFDDSNPDIRFGEGGNTTFDGDRTGYSRNPDVNKGGNVIFDEFEDDDNRKRIESFWNNFHRQPITKELKINKIDYKIYEDKIIIDRSYQYGNFNDFEKAKINKLFERYANSDFIKDYSTNENKIMVRFANTSKLKKKKNPFIDEEGNFSYPYFFENLKIEDGTKYIGKKFTDVFGRDVGFPFYYKKFVRQYNSTVKRLEQNNYSTEGRRKSDLNKLKQMEKTLDKRRYLAGFVLDSTGYIIAYEPFQE